MRSAWSCVKRNTANKVSRRIRHGARHGPAAGLFFAMLHLMVRGVSCRWNIQSLPSIRLKTETILQRSAFIGEAAKSSAQSDIFLQRCRVQERNQPTCCIQGWLRRQVMGQAWARDFCCTQRQIGPRAPGTPSSSECKLRKKWLA